MATTIDSLLLLDYTSTCHSKHIFEHQHSNFEMNIEHAVMKLDQLQRGGVTFIIERSGPEFAVVLKQGLLFEAGNELPNEEGAGVACATATLSAGDAQGEGEPGTGNKFTIIQLIKNKFYHSSCNGKRRANQHCPRRRGAS